MNSGHSRIERRTREWPTPSFDRPDISYECAMCGTVVLPKDGNKQAGLLIAGSTIKVCGQCADDLRYLIQGAE